MLLQRNSRGLLFCADRPERVLAPWPQRLLDATLSAWTEQSGTPAGSLRYSIPNLKTVLASSRHVTNVNNGGSLGRNVLEGSGRLHWACCKSTLAKSSSIVPR